MADFKVLAEPFWVNLTVLIPVINLFVWKKHPLEISQKLIAVSSIFGIAFGFTEAITVVYLRASAGLLSLGNTYQQADLLQKVSINLLTLEFLREIATIIMLFSIAFIVSKRRREFWAIFFLTFAFWDIFYYVFLKLAVNWPANLTTYDVLFLIPTPWVSQVWFPVLVSSLLIFSVLVSRKR